MKKNTILIFQVKKIQSLILGKIRRVALVFLNKEKVRTSLSNRQGTCLQCASCCKLLFNCPFLSASNHCLIYHSSLRPLVCKKFPLDHLDIYDVMISSGNQCGYKF